LIPAAARACARGLGSIACPSLPDAVFASLGAVLVALHDTRLVDHSLALAQVNLGLPVRIEDAPVGLERREREIVLAMRDSQWTTKWSKT
jgi:hypothetical protein